MTLSSRISFSNYASNNTMGLLDYLNKKTDTKGTASLFTQYSNANQTNSTNPLLSLLSNNSNSNASSLWSTYNQYGKVPTTNQASGTIQPPVLTDADSTALAELIKKSDINKDGKLSLDDIAGMKTNVAEQIKTLQAEKPGSIEALKKQQTQLSSLTRQANYVSYLQQNYTYLSKLPSYSNTLA